VAVCHCDYTAQLSGRDDRWCRICREDIANGLALGLGIGAQNILEGLAVSVSLLALGYDKWRAFWIGSLTGLVEPVGGIIGAAAIWLAEPAIPIILGIAAGAMLFIISNEVIPETHRAPDKHLATFSLLLGRCADALHECCAQVMLIVTTERLLLIRDELAVAVPANSSCRLVHEERP
jgi:hypothetical protein